MKKIDANNINVKIFCALKISELTGIPALLMSNPGAGKTTSVEMFAKIRGYELVTLRGNSETSETVLGYDCAPGLTVENADTARSAIHLRPSWFEKVLENEANGKKSLLFLDEITTAPESVQSSLLHLIQQRFVGPEPLPKSTLVVSAGNFALNLSNSMTVLPPLLNRFFIFNVFPTEKDLSVYLCRHSGAAVGKKENYIDQLEKALEELNKEEISIDEDTSDIIYDLIERTVTLATEELVTKKKHNFLVTDFSGIYNDFGIDNKMPGFITMRSLNNLRDITLATYRCFGKKGISMGFFKDIVYGLVGVGITRSTDNSGAVTYISVLEDFMKAITNVTKEIEKLNNPKLPKYNKFFQEYINTNSGKKTIMDTPNSVMISNKLRELMADKNLSDIERPIDPIYVEKLCDIIKRTARSVSNIKLDSVSKVSDQITPESFTATVSKWVSINTVFEDLCKLVNEASRNYLDDTKKIVTIELSDIMKKCLFKLQSIRQLIVMDDESFGNLIPTI